ncbi:hypothetical protein X975_10906, partial [Stegodyphus mimosarum]
MCIFVLHIYNLVTKCSLLHNSKFFLELGHTRCKYESIQIFSINQGAIGELGQWQKVKDQGDHLKKKLSKFMRLFSRVKTHL